MTIIQAKDWDRKAEVYMWAEIGAGELLKVRAVTKQSLIFAGAIGTSWQGVPSTRLYQFVSDDERKETLRSMRAALAQRREGIRQEASL